MYQFIISLHICYYFSASLTERESKNILYSKITVKYFSNTFYTLSWSFNRLPCDSLEYCKITV